MAASQELGPGLYNPRNKWEKRNGFLGLNVMDPINLGGAWMKPCSFFHSLLSWEKVGALSLKSCVCMGPKKIVSEVNSFKVLGPKKNWGLFNLTGLSSKAMVERVNQILGKC